MYLIIYERNEVIASFTTFVEAYKYWVNIKSERYKYEIACILDLAKPKLSPKEDKEK